MTIQAASAQVEFSEDSYQAGRDLGGQILGKISLQAHSVGILFCCVQFDLDQLLAGLRETIDIPVVGCTSYSEVTEDGYSDESASLLVLSSDTLSVGLGLGEEMSKDVHASVTRAWDQARTQLGPSGPRLVLTFPDAALTSLAETALDEVVSHAGDALVAGALPGDGGMFKKTFQICAGRVYSDSVPILLLGGDMNPRVVTRSGWLPMGKVATATKTDGSKLIEIDGERAIDFLKHYVMNVEDPEIIGTYPIALLDLTLTDEHRKHLIIRSPFFHDPVSGAVAYAGRIPEGCAIQITRGSREDILQGARDAAEALMALSPDGISAVLFLSCAGRKLRLGAAAEQELSTVRSVFPAGTPIAGFYSYGEIGPIDSSIDVLRRPRFHNCTIVMVAL